MIQTWEKRRNIYSMKRGGSMMPAVAWSVAALFVFACRLASLKRFVTCAALCALGFVDALPACCPGASWDKKTGLILPAGIK